MHRIECMRCGAEWDADARDVRSWQRDGPHEISIEMECPSCRVEGVLHIHGGPQVPEEHAVVLHTLLDK